MKKKYLIIPIIVVITITCYLCYQHFNRENIVFKNNAIKKENNMLSMMYETALGSGIYQEQITSNWPTSGYTFNEELSNCENGSELSWDNINKKVVVKSRVSDRCYVYFDVIQPEYVYWNNSFPEYNENLLYYQNQLPSGTGLLGTFNTREELFAAMDYAFNYGDFSYATSQVPIYIKSTKSDGIVILQETCLYSENDEREYCIAPNYWDTDGETTLAKIKSDVQNQYGYSEQFANAYCNFEEASTGPDYVYCNLDLYGSSSGQCYAYADGSVSCNTIYVACDIELNGAYCFEG